MTSAVSPQEQQFRQAQKVALEQIRLTELRSSLEARLTAAELAAEKKNPADVQRFAETNR